MRAPRVASAAVASCAIVGVLGLAPRVAGAHDARFDGRATIETNPAFHGRVISQKAGCERRREVQIYREESGPDGLFATTETNSEGRWELLTGDGLTGDFYARVRRTRIGPSGHAHVCRGGRSQSVRVQPPLP